ncbi:adenylate kinase [Naasia sp. SYSU D00948]|uniref:adenylate kinase n=1 Tax=Naasia sp. SYSU D00948 TaxID=2817379 RepID=UPI001B30DE17|nr:adenylate kinase [Naasia sp. SYSU D00948]
MSRLLIIGPPGAGKGTQAARLSVRLDVPAVSTGDIFRDNVRNGTELGVLAKSYMDRGEYVPDSVTDDLVKDRLSAADATGGFLLDGYPRTIAQVRSLDEYLAERGESLDAVIQLTADHEETVQRLLRRAKEQGRSDDTEDVIRRRLEVYAEQTAPLIDLFASRGVLVSVDGLGSIDEVTDRIVQALDGLGITAPAA